MPRAARDMMEASTWWRANRLAAPDLFRDELARTLALVALQPSLGTRVRSEGLPGVRQVILQRVGYVVYYRVRSRLSRIDVLRVWHASRGSRPG